MPQISLPVQELGQIRWDLPGCFGVDIQVDNSPPPQRKQISFDNSALPNYDRVDL